MDFKHYILTRLNLGKYSNDWTLNRLKIMEKWLLQSMRHQTNKGYMFGVIICDRTPKEIVDMIKDSIKDINGFILTDTRSGVFKEKLTITDDCGWNKEFLALNKGFSGVVATTRIDSDDFLLPRFVAKINKSILRHPIPSVICSSGCFFVDQIDKKYLISTNTSLGDFQVPSCGTLLESSNKIETVYKCSHTKLHHLYKTINIGGLLWGRSFRKKRNWENAWSQLIVDSPVYCGEFYDYNNFISNSNVTMLIG